ncbi:MAG: hypothetical protein HY521_06850 [Proteobacteria bacterium]|nr:hypothetical protein [Pseudomonadota bacterium]
MSVVLLTSYRFDVADTALRFNPQHASVLNVGKGNRLIIVAASEGEPDSVKGEENTGSEQPAHETSPYGPGDRKFLHALSELPEPVQEAGRSILARVRGHFPGDLKALDARRFVETPDNFWAVVIQPRDRSLAFTVRGMPDRFETQRLRLTLDRSPYSRFKVTSIDDVAEAVGIILRAIRKAH